MPQTLAQLVRAKYPGSYDDLSDQQLEAQVRAKFPGVYDDLPSSASEPAKPEGSALGRFASNAWEMVNPVEIVKGAATAVRHPIDTGKALIGAQLEQGKQAAAMYRQGRYSEALGHAGAAAVPVLGPIAAQAGEQIGSGDIAGGLGKTAGILAPFGAAEAVRGVRGVRVVPGLKGSRTAADAEAIAAGQAAGVPIDAALATGNRGVRAVQHVADRTIGGSLVASKAEQAQARGLATMGEQLAAKGYETPMTPEAAGQVTREAVSAKVAQYGKEADEAYSALREIEARPEHLRTVQARSFAPDTPQGAMGQPALTDFKFAKEGTGAEELFQRVLGDARRQGFTGSAEDLRGAFAERVKSARELGADMAAVEGENGPAALLAEIRRRGGLKPFENDYVAGAPTQKLRGEFRGMQEAFERNWGHKGGGSVMRANGRGADELAQSLSEDPKWAGQIPNDGEALKEMLYDIARNGPNATGAADIQHLLKGVGVEPGAQWWKGAVSENTVEMPLPVDLRPAKAQLQPVYQELLREREINGLMMGQKGRALAALDRLVGPEAVDYAPLSTVDSALSDLKAFTRPKAGKIELATAGQGKIKLAISKLEKAVEDTANSADFELNYALKAGREATKAKVSAHNVLKEIRTEDVAAYRQATQAGDLSVGRLRRLAKQAPDQIPAIGRAFIDDLLSTATNSPEGFGHRAAIASKWEKLGPETKRILYKDPGYIRELDNFFRLVRMTAENANPSGTAHTALAYGQVAHTAFDAMGGLLDVLGTAAVSRLLHSPRGVRLLSKGIKMPLGSPAARAAYLGEVSAVVGRETAKSPTGYQTAPEPAR